MPLVNKDFQAEKKKSVSAKSDAQGGLDNLKAEFASANTIAQLKQVLKKVFKVLDLFDKGD